MGKKAIKQVHLDFHTSPDIAGVGARFSKENFQAALKASKAESITVFAKCHHGYCYYPTAVGTMHPQLDFDLTGAMVEAAHEIGVKAPIYITAGWSHLDSETHHEWRVKNESGAYTSMGQYLWDADPETPKGDCHWQHMCLNDGSYAAHIYAITEEVCKRYPVVDGLFYDICTIGEACYCDECKAGMLAMGMDPDSLEDAKRYYVLGRRRFMTKCNEILQAYHPGATIFFNGTAQMEKPEFFDCQSHFEMENLPTAWGGYDGLPLSAKFFKNTGKHVIGMTGKFHLDWGEFGGFKCKEALKYETATMATYGVGTSIGDHMHPDGEMEMQTYENIGFAFDYLDKIAPYCFAEKSTAEVGLLATYIGEAHEGISRILIENQIDYDLIKDDDFAAYQVVIVPDGTRLAGESLARLKQYVQEGGKLLMMGDALLQDGAFALDIGVRSIGASVYDCDYIEFKDKIDGIPDAPLLCNLAGHRVEAVDAEVVGECLPPYFNRTYGHFCGHKNTPHDKNATKYPAVTKKGNLVYLAHSIPTQYFRYGSLFHKRCFMAALGLVYTPALQVEGLGAQGRCRLVDQPEERRLCLNMVYAVPTRRGMAEIIEDMMPVYDIRVSLATDKAIKRVHLPLENAEVDYTYENGILTFTVPKLQCHNVAVIEY